MGKSNIEWTEQTWNPVVGCSILTPGCTNCYAMRDAWRKHHIKALPHYHGLTKKVKGNPVWTGKLAMAPDSILLAPLKRKKPTLYFVNSMGDLFHEDCPDEWIDRVFAVMALSPQHTFQVLTKRAARMREYLTAGTTVARADIRNHLAWNVTVEVMRLWRPDWMEEDIDGPHRSRAAAAFMKWPLPNVWLGVSCERQQEADERIPLLLQTPAAVRFISAEPLLGPIDLNSLEVNGDATCAALRPDTYEAIWEREWKGTTGNEADERAGFLDWFNLSEMRTGKVHPGLDWVIAGGESGPKARPMHPDWPRALRDQCKAAGVAFHFKQWGEFLPWSQFNGTQIEDDPEQTKFRTREWRGSDWKDVGYPMWCDSVDGGINDQNCVARVGKAKAGRLLDGVEHNEFPRTPA